MLCLVSSLKDYFWHTKLTYCLLHFLEKKKKKLFCDFIYQILILFNLNCVIFSSILCTNKLNLYPYFLQITVVWCQANLRLFSRRGFITGFYRFKFDTIIYV